MATHGLSWPVDDEAKEEQEIDEKDQIVGFSSPRMHEKGKMDGWRAVKKDTNKVCSSRQTKTGSGASHVCVRWAVLAVTTKVSAAQLEKARGTVY